ncbi:MAG TPA: hypothetical protein VMS17_10370, partial [Gemmataceae bacterium]|nr:hypothetical protein [Gemmataceae bacterium]
MLGTRSLARRVRLGARSHIRRRPSIRRFIERVSPLELAPSAVAAVADAVTRNRLITRSYWEISRRMRDLLGRDAGANWCTFAAWASRRAGRTIRGEDCSALSAWLLRAVTLGDLDRERARTNAAVGNHQVYAEIAPQFVRFLLCFQDRSRREPGRLRAFLRGLRRGGPNQRDLAGRPGQGLLRKAFRNYYRALRARSVVQQRRFTFLANLQVALHEQNHLQDVIAQALPRAGWLRRWTTAIFLALPLPGGESAPVSHDPPGDPARRRHCINDPARGLLAQFGVGESARGCGASDWADLGQRMRFIIALMRNLHDDP